MTIARFQELFEALTGNQPFPWQTELARRLLNADVPMGCNLPTGTGKTSVISIWVICLGLQALSGQVTLPRRLIYAVNRRVIVDQATEEANRIIAALSDHAAEPQAIALRAALETLAATWHPAGVSPVAVTEAPTLAASRAPLAKATTSTPTPPPRWCACAALKSWRANLPSRPKKPNRKAPNNGAGRIAGRVFIGLRQQRQLVAIGRRRHANRRRDF